MTHCCKTNAAMTSQPVRRAATALALACATLALSACTQYYIWQPAQQPVLAQRADLPAPTPMPTPAYTPSAASRPGSAQDFADNASDRVFFDTDSAALDAWARATLNAQAAWLSRHPEVQVRIEGNADERGQQQYNLALGQRRAQTVQAYLSSHGISAARIFTVSNGETQPIATGSNAAALARNRNVHTVIIAERVQ
jgi:peptidoglycan-associated lipoprotein